MNGNRYLLDTNAIITLLQKDYSLVQLLKDDVYAKLLEALPKLFT